MRRSIFLTSAIGIALLGLAFLLFSFIAGPTQDVEELGEQFMTALQDQQLDDAYEMMAPELQSGVTRSEFDEHFLGVEVDGWSFEELTQSERSATMLGRATVNAVLYDLELEFINENGRWRVFGYDLEPVA